KPASAASSPDRLPSKPSAGVRLFLLAVWAACLLAALGFVGICGSNIPWMDEYDLVPVVTGHRHVTADWLWAQHNEDRIPLSYLLSLGLLGLSGNDFRAGMMFNVLGLGALALALLGTASAVRGRPSYADAFFPLVLLQWGQAQNFLWSAQVVVISTVLLEL